jgi:hypothetical protein
VGRCQQGLGHSKANAAACAGNNDYLGFHVPSGKARPLGEDGGSAKSVSRNSSFPV